MNVCTYAFTPTYIRAYICVPACTYIHTLLNSELITFWFSLYNCQNEKNTFLNRKKARNSTLRAIIYQAEQRPESWCPVSWSYYLSHSMTKKLGTEKRGNKKPSCEDRQNQALTGLYLIVHCPMHLCCFPPLSKSSWSWGLNRAHLANNIQIEIGRKTKAKFILTLSSFQAPTFLWRTIVIFKGKKAIFNNEKWIPLPTNISTTASHRSITYGTTSRKADVIVSSHLCLFFTELSQQRQEIGVGEEDSSLIGKDRIKYLSRKCFIFTEKEKLFLLD